jgi:8-oxo-dGTP pyrophosphatase MutT (NUDIX family)
VIRSERVVDENRHIRLSTADVELPDGTQFTQYVIRMPRTVATVVLDDKDRVLLIRRHRFIIDRWVWELPGGYVLGEDGAAAAAREVEEETGWRLTGPVEFVLTYQPIIGSGDCPQDVYLAHGAARSGTEPDLNETEQVAWLPVTEIPAMVAAGEIVGAATIIGALHTLAGRRYHHTRGMPSAASDRIVRLPRS